MPTYNSNSVLVEIVGGGSGTPIEAAASALSAGQAADFATTGFTLSNADTGWQTDFWYDPVNKKCHYMGKPASAPGAWKHRIYDEASNTWNTTNQYANPPNVNGHAYGAGAIDPGTGDFYFHFFNESFVRRYTASTQSWDFSTVSESLIGGGATTPCDGLAFHPNLYGAGDGGLVISTRSDLFTWRKSNNTWTELLSYSYAPDARKEGHGYYWPGGDIAFVGRGINTTTAYYGVSSGPTSINGGMAYPNGIAVAGIGIGTFGGMLCAHPTDPTRIFILERPASGSANRVWESTNGINWTQKSYSHGLTWTDSYGSVAFLTIHGAIWGLGSQSGNVLYSRLWRPDD